MKKIILSLFCFTGSLTIVAQNSGIAINDAGANPHPSAILDVTSTSKGFLTPRMTSMQRDAITSPATGLLIYNTSSNCLNFYNGSSWNEDCGTCAVLNTIVLSSASNTTKQTVTQNSAITDITYTTTKATGVISSGLPAGITATWSANKVTISGKPSETGTFNYTITLTGGCGTVTASGSITVTP
jgi:hypothetical protein